MDVRYIHIPHIHFFSARKVFLFCVYAYLRRVYKKKRLLKKKKTEINKLYLSYMEKYLKARY
ncbi:hypothetical protein HQ47_03050 [Porphyromonas macacae]|uniref:Uncharacterized protein n=1 Tax=Porphyromonas macacae TaxID=28115 RepID=A0A0A2E7P5_9PORP|nr:hypothetical protein HQ47_03050 [Porphyromonas macacae]